MPATAPTSVAPSGAKRSPIAFRSIFSRSSPVAASNSRVDARRRRRRGERLAVRGEGDRGRSEHVGERDVQPLLAGGGLDQLHRERLPAVAADRDGRAVGRVRDTSDAAVDRTGGGPVPGPCPPPTGGRSTRSFSTSRTRPRRGACRPGRRPPRTRCRRAGTSGSPRASRGRSGAARSRRPSWITTAFPSGREEEQVAVAAGVGGGVRNPGRLLAAGHVVKEDGVVADRSASIASVLPSGDTATPTPDPGRGRWSVGRGRSRGRRCGTRRACGSRYWRRRSSRRGTPRGSRSSSGAGSGASRTAASHRRGVGLRERVSWPAGWVGPRPGPARPLGLLAIGGHVVIPPRQPDRSGRQGRGADQDRDGDTKAIEHSVP